MINQGATEQEIDQYIAYKGVTAEQLRAQQTVKPQESQPTEEDSGFVRGLGVGTRAVAEGAASLPLLVGDAANSLVNLGIQGINKVFDTDIQELPSASQSAANLLDKTGLPRPQTEEGKLVAALNRGAAGALSVPGAAALAKPVSKTAQSVLSQVAAKPITQGIAGASAGGAGETVKQGGGSQGEQLGASLAAGLVAPLAASGAVSATTSTARGVRELARPLTHGGRQVVASRALQGLARKPTGQVVQNLETAPQHVKGSVPTTGQAAKDTGLLLAEKHFRGKRPEQFTERFFEQNQARRLLLDKLAKNEDAISAAKSDRNAAALPFLAKAIQANKQIDISPVVGRIDAALKGPGGKRKILRDTLTGLRKEFFDEDGNLISDIRSIHQGIRQNIDDLMRGKLKDPDLSGAKFLKKELGAIKSQLDKRIGKTGPEFKTFVEKFKQFSRPIEKLEKLQDIRGKTTNAATDLEGTPVISQAKFKTQFNKNRRELKQVMNPLEFKRAERIVKDLDRGALSQTVGKPPGSDTFQNFSSANVIGSMIGKSFADTPFFRTVGRPLNFIFRFGDNEIEEIMVEAMLDPKTAAMLLRKATPANIKSLSARLKEHAVAVSEGALSGTATQLQPQPQQ